MKLIYITAKKYPSSKVDPFYVKSMAIAFDKILGKNFEFVVRGSIPNELRSLNIRTVGIPNRLRSLFYFMWIPFFIYFNRYNRKDVVFLSYDPYLLTILIFWRKLLRFKYFICSDWHQMFGDWKDKYVSTNSNCLTTTSDRLKKLIISVCGINTGKISTIYGGVDTHPFRQKDNLSKRNLRRSLVLPENDFLVGYVGGFASVGMKKGLDTMIKALRYTGRNVKMIFVGGSRQAIDEYIFVAKEHNVHDRCIFVTKQPFEKVVEYEMAMDILVIPYPNKPHFRDYGFPMKIWEYLASGRPIIYSDLEIMGEVLGERATSFIPEDEKSLSGAIISIYENMDKAENLSKQNIIDVNRFTWEERAKNIINFIQTKL